MASRMVVYNREGAPVAEIEATVRREWLLNDVGKAEFSMSAMDAKCRQDVLMFGNLVLIEHGTLPAWVGRLDPDQSWGGGVTELTAYAAETLLGDAVPEDTVKVTGTGGAIFRRLLELANQQLDMPILGGDIFLGGGQHEETVNTVEVLGEVKRVASRCGYDFEVAPRVGADGRLSLAANWYEEMGTERTLALVEGVNVTVPSNGMRVQGTIKNIITGYGDGATRQSRPRYTARDEESIRLYGSRRGVETFVGVTQPATLQKNTLAELRKQGRPRWTLRLTAWDAWVGEVSTFASIRLGDRLPVRLFSIGYGAVEMTMRVLGMRYDGISTLDLVVDEVIE